MLYAVSGYIASRYNCTRKYMVLSGVWSLVHEPVGLVGTILGE